MDKMNLLEKHNIESFGSDFEKLKELLGSDAKVSYYLQWMTLRELRLISNDTDSIDKKTPE